MLNLYNYAALVSGNIRMASDGRTSTVAFTTETVDRHGTLVVRDGIEYAAYLRDNPVVLWNHGQDPARGADPRPQPTPAPAPC